VESAITEIIDAGAHKLVIDLTGLDMIDSSGIGVLINRIVGLDADCASACAHLSSGAATA
jgi:anti-anti-sigma factor